MTVRDFSNTRKNQIRRRLLKIVSYMNVLLGFTDLIIAVVINHNNDIGDDIFVAVYAVTGIICVLIGEGGIHYEEILKRRATNDGRNVSFIS